MTGRELTSSVNRPRSSKQASWFMLLLLVVLLSSGCSLARPQPRKADGESKTPAVVPSPSDNTAAQADGPAPPDAVGNTNVPADAEWDVKTGSWKVKSGSWGVKSGGWGVQKDR